MTRIQDQFPGFVPPSLPEPDHKVSPFIYAYSEPLVEEYAEAYITSFLAYLASSTQRKGS